MSKTWTSGISGTRGMNMVSMDDIEKYGRIFFFWILRNRVSKTWTSGISGTSGMNMVSMDDIEFAEQCLNYGLVVNCGICGTGPQMVLNMDSW